MLAELERVADYLILMSQGRVQVAGEVDDLLAGHRILTGPAAEDCDLQRIPGGSRPPRRMQAHMLVQTTADDGVPSGWESHPVGLEELALAYLREPDSSALPGPSNNQNVGARG